MKLEAVSQLIERWVAPVANKVASQRHIQVLQSAFLTLISFFTIGSFALILISPAMDYTAMEPGFGRSFFEGWQAFATFTGPVLGPLYAVTMGAISLYVAAGLGFYLGKQHKQSTFIPVAVALSSFLILAAVSAEGTLVTTYFDGTGLFTAIFASILSVELYQYLIRKNVGKIELSGAGVPPALTESMAALVPISIVMIVVSLLGAVVNGLTGGPFPSLMTTIMSPLVSIVDSPWGVLVLSLLVMTLWWFGIHDTVITGPLAPFLVNNLTANASAFAAGTAAVSLPYIVTEPFWWTFMAIGGSGATLGLAFLAFRSKSKQIRTVGRLALVPSFFNINEPLIFGLPLMFNPIMMFPFIVTMTANGVITYLMMSAQLVGRTFADPSWNMFSPVGALLSTMDFRAVLLVLGLIVMDALIYLPFFKIYEKQKIAEEKLEDDLQTADTVAAE